MVAQSVDIKVNDQLDGGHDKRLAALPTTARLGIRHFDGRFHHFRYVVITLGGVMTGLMFLFRFTINVSIISMVNKTAIYYSEHPNATSTGDFFAPDYIETGQFDWNHEIQQIILTGYMVSYAIPQYFATRLAIKHGLRLSIALCVSLCAVSCILTPYFAHHGWHWVLALRLLNGIGASAIMPISLSLIELWVPANECSQALALIQFTVGVLVCSVPMISGYLTAYHWRWSFYVPGVAGLAICLLWYLVTADTPAKSRLISRRELEHIYGAHRVTNDGQLMEAENAKEAHPTNVPWHFVFKIKSFYFLGFGLMMLDATASGVLFILPTYITRVLHLPVHDVGLMTTSVQVGSIFCTLFPKPCEDLLQRVFNLSLTAARKLMVFACCVTVCSTFFYLAFCHENLIVVLTVNRFAHVAIDFILLSTIMSKFSSEGLSGLVFSVVNAIGNLAVLACCWTMGRVLDYAGNSLESWSWIFSTLSGMMIIYFFNYVLFLSSEPVHVDLPNKKKKSSSKADLC